MTTKKNDLTTTFCKIKISHVCICRVMSCKRLKCYDDDFQRSFTSQVLGYLADIYV